MTWTCFHDIAVHVIWCIQQMFSIDMKLTLNIPQEKCLLVTTHFCPSCRFCGGKSTLPAYSTWPAWQSQLHSAEEMKKRHFTL